MGFEYLDGGEVAVIADERIHTVALLVVLDGGLIDRPFQVVSTQGHVPVLGVGLRPAALLLLEGAPGGARA